MALTAPTHFGKYVLFRKIATGGMAELYLATNTELRHVERLIAIKKLLPHLADEENFVQAFIDEARLAAALRHQNIVQIYDCGTTGGSHYIEMEYLLGKDLAQVLNKAKLNAQPLSLAYSLFIVAQICLGLDYAHKRKDTQGKPLNIIHRDVSPQNIVITYEGNVKMVDFGIAKAATQSTKTQVGMIKGKIAYMSPEQAEGQAIDHRSDIFSIGIILYELVTARRMFRDEDTLKLLTLVRRAEFEPPEHVNKDLPPPLYTILHKSLAKDPEQRYRFADEMLTDLEECMHHLPTWPTSRGLSQYMHQLFAEDIEDQPLTSSLPPRVLDAKETPAKSKRPWLWYAAIAEAVLILGLGALFLLKDTPPIAPEMANLQAQLKQARWEVETEQQRRVQLEAQRGQLQDSLQRHEQEARQLQQEVTTAQRAAQAARAESQQWHTRYQEATQQLQQVQADFERVKAEATATHTRLEAEVAQRTTEGIQPQARDERLRQQWEARKQGQEQSEEQGLPETVRQQAKESEKRGMEALAEGRCEEAAEHFQTALALDSSWEETLKKSLARALQCQASSLMGKKQLEKAEVLLLESVKMDPASVEGYNQLGNLYYEQENYLEAAANYQEAVGLDPKFYKAFFNLGLVYMKLKKNDKAEIAFDTVVKLQPPNIDDASYMLARAQNNLGKNEKCRKNLQWVHKNYPEHESAKLYRCEPRYKDR